MPVVNTQSTQVTASNLSDNISTSPLANMSYSGADIVATMIIPIIGQDGKIESTGDVIELGDLQTVSYSIHRENIKLLICTYITFTTIILNPDLRYLRSPNC